MSYTDPSSSNVEEKPILSKIGCVSVLIPVVGLLYLYISWEQRPPLQPILDAEPYVWPEGCPKRRYDDTKMEPMPLACMQEKYAIKDWFERGLFTAGSKNRHPNGNFYYRIGNDAVAIGCTLGGDECWVRNVEYNFFQINNEKDRH